MVFQREREKKNFLGLHNLAHIFNRKFIHIKDEDRQTRLFVPWTNLLMGHGPLSDYHLKIEPTTTPIHAIPA
jgi:hypothetical protein